MAKTRPSSRPTAGAESLGEAGYFYGCAVFACVGSTKTFGRAFAQTVTAARGEGINIALIGFGDRHFVVGDAPIDFDGRQIDNALRFCCARKIEYGACAVENGI